MTKIIINSRDELICIEPELIAVVQANGNYSRIVYINKKEINLTLGISKVEEMLKSRKGTSKFIRLGRSIIVNHSYLHKIDLLRQMLVLSDNGANEIRVNLSKKIIKPYKEAVVESINIKNKRCKE